MYAEISFVLFSALLILVSSKQIGHQKADHYNWKETAEDKIYK